MIAVVACPDMAAQHRSPASLDGGKHPLLLRRQRRPVMLPERGGLAAEDVGDFQARSAKWRRGRKHRAEERRVDADGPQL